MKPIKIKIVVESVYKKEGEKNGKKWARFGLKSETDIWYNFFGAKWNEHLQDCEGQEVEFEYIEEEYNGKTSNNIINPNSYDVRIKDLEERILKIEKKVWESVKEDDGVEKEKDEEIPF